MKLMILIVPKTESDQISKIIGSYKIDFQAALPAKGTAPTEMLEYLSLGEKERDLIFSIVDDLDVEKIFEELKSKMNFLDSGHGVAFTISIDAITKLSYQYLYNELQTDGGNA
ncbi:MAG: hypothetical protein AB7E09_02425 [Candidatus Izemoplasmatales bacterium]|uniref:P-II family nitrogen regulator n=1 Tax=Hujiaoplasma nucleasis TaxID=2725268 RepID=A0A7L6N4Q8_9MOLU|nr:hypothetical protein [Hujiaoplasma nucleasis]QLY39975.1 hypothetical protein HF295_03515 [Hujiaoplasma nucleasis]